MTSAAQRPIDATLLGGVRAAGSVHLVSGGRLGVRHEDRLELHDRTAFLAGGPSLLHSLALPRPARAASLPDGSVVAAESARIRAVGPDGHTRWALPHPVWHHGSRGPRPPGAPVVSPDGLLVCAVVPTLGPDTEERGYGRDTLLLLEAATGAVLAERPVGSIASGMTGAWHPDGHLMALSCWTAWASWTTWWVEPRHDGLHIRGGVGMHEVVGFVPGTRRALTLRRAEHIAVNDDRDELAAHDAASDEQTALFDLSALAADPENDEFTAASLIDGAHVLVVGRVFPRCRPPATRHWLCDARTLAPLGRLRYPRRVGTAVTALGDGTWLTRHGDEIHHWALPAHPAPGRPRLTPQGSLRPPHSSAPDRTGGPGHRRQGCPARYSVPSSVSSVSEGASVGAVAASWASSSRASCRPMIRLNFRACGLVRSRTATSRRSAGISRSVPLAWLDRAWTASFSASASDMPSRCR